eukprot:CAMPEP_0115323636 /NCGR_PEP_ID=MMETSP0270-20121206/82049_1 /TAXON_ID=71861 /ORGANISM="Scrippsiella trochoidea, Strain CCMP3099" /LENGTH=211 /DNA_ID=CAMNT_0002743697 /DNA_START=26 /DNA_END=658 /DNA_ORIENTATION=-
MAPGSGLRAAPVETRFRTMPPRQSPWPDRWFGSAARSHLEPPPPVLADASWAHDDGHEVDVQLRPRLLGEVGTNASRRLSTEIRVQRWTGFGAAGCANLDRIVVRLHEDGLGVVLATGLARPSARSWCAPSVVVAAQRAQAQGLRVELAWEGELRSAIFHVLVAADVLFDTTGECLWSEPRALARMLADPRGRDAVVNCAVWRRFPLHPCV